MKKISLFLALMLVLSLLLVSCTSGDGKYAEFYSDNVTGSVTLKSLSQNSLADTSAFEPKIIRNANLVGETKTFDETISKLNEKIAEYKGYISESSTYGNDEDGHSATITFRIPADKLDAFLTDAQDAIHITSSTVSSNDITTNYYDTAARLETLRAEKASLDAMLAAATTVQETITISERLYNVIEEIESYETQMQIYNDKIAYSTVTLRLEEVGIYSPSSENFSTRIATAFKNSWIGFANFFKGFAVVIVYAIPTLLTLGALSVGIVFFVKWRMKCTLKKNEEIRKKISKESKEDHE